MSSDFVRYSPEIETFDPKAQPGAQHVLDDGVDTPRRLRRQGPHRSGRGQRRKAIHHHLDLKSGPDVFGPTLAEELRAHAFDFDLQVQLCTDLTAMPVNDATVEWPEKLSPFVTVGRVHLPCQDISRPEDFEKGDALAFNQWRVISDHRPLGEIMDAPEDDRGSRRRAGHEP